MSTKFSDFMKEIEAEAQAEGPEAVEELNALHKHFKQEVNEYILFESYPKEYMINSLKRIRRKYPAVYRNFFLFELEEEIKENG